MLQEPKLIDASTDSPKILSPIRNAYLVTVSTMYDFTRNYVYKLINVGFFVDYTATV